MGEKVIEIMDYYITKTNKVIPSFQLYRNIRRIKECLLIDGELEHAKKYIDWYIEQNELSDDSLDECIADYYNLLSAALSILEEKENNNEFDYEQACEYEIYHQGCSEYLLIYINDSIKGKEKKKSKD